MEYPEDGLVTVHGQGASFTFQIQEADEDHNNVTIWGGDDYGTATIKRCTLDDLIQGVHKFDPDGKIINIGTDDDD